MGKIKALGKSGQQKETNGSLSPRDQMLKICNTVWTSRTPEQIKGCEKMLATYIQANGKDNIGVTFIEVEISRQIRLNALFAKMGQVQQELQKQNAEKQQVQKGMSTEQLKAANIKRVNAEQTKIMNEKIKKEKKN